MPHMKISQVVTKHGKMGTDCTEFQKSLFTLVFYFIHFALICPIMKIRNLSIGPSEVEFVLNVIGLRSSCGVSLAQY